MNDEGHISAPATKATYGFLLITLAMLASVVLWKVSLIEEDTLRRLLGISIGLLMMLVGNSLPKTRFLKAFDSTSLPATTAERVIGWALVLAGAAVGYAYVTDALSLATRLSAYLGAALVLTIVVTVLVFWRSAYKHRALEGQTTRKTGAPRKGLILLLTLTWILAGAFAKYLWGDRSWNASPIAAISLVALYIAVIPLLMSSKRWNAGRENRNGRRRRPTTPDYGGF